MGFGRLRRDNWRYLGVAIVLVTTTFGQRVIRLTDALDVRLMITVGLFAVISLGLVLIWFKGPGD